MGTFGNRGTRTPRNDDVGAVQVKVSEGEHLSYSLTVQGAEGVFTFACTHLDRLSEKDFPGHPKASYDWCWGKCPPAPEPFESASKSDATDDMYVMRMSFITALRYTLVVKHHRGDGSVIQTLKDVDYESQDPNDKFGELLRVFTA